MNQKQVEEPPSSEAMILKWAFAQIEPWASKSNFKICNEDYVDFLERINDNSHNIFILDFLDGELSVRRKVNPHVTPASGSFEDIRIRLYSAFLSVVVERFKLTMTFSIALCVGDIVGHEAAYPIFGFQKKADSQVILLPDPDFIQFNFYQEDVPELKHSEKLNQIIFCGSSTGKMLSIEDVVGNCSERLHYAQYFHKNKNIVIKIGAATQCLTDDARQALQQKSYFCPISWDEQLRRKYILSIDGNGATCSRVILTLKSQSVLLKACSDDRLYYFDDLIAWKHYIPVESVEDLERVSKELSRGHLKTDDIVRSANAFYSMYLTKNRVEEYMFNLLLLFSKI